VSSSTVSIFGQPVDLHRLRWDQDFFTGFVFPTRRHSCLIRLEDYFDKGIEIKAPLEASRFHFGVRLAVDYRRSGSEEPYQTFRGLVLDWIRANPFLRGINWLIPMDAAIRAVNWIVACNLFGPLFWRDREFADGLSVSLARHAQYLYRFPETPRRAPATNHAVADYTGLLFLALTLRSSPQSAAWERTAVEGLERCIREQVNTEGVHFEKSLPYHRFVLECFAVAALLASANGVRLSDRYYETLASMFAYTAQYVTVDGHSPQLGDNDSGRLLEIDDGEESFHGYLFSLFRTIFEGDIAPWFPSDPTTHSFLPLPSLRIPSPVPPILRSGSFRLPKSGIYVFRNSERHLFVAVQPVGMDGQGGHNHVDAGSFTLLLGGRQVVVDPGTYTYTRSLEERRRYRSPEMHNFILTRKDSDAEYSTGYWDIKNYPEVADTQASDRSLAFSIVNAAGEEKRRRIDLTEEVVHISDSCPSDFTSLLHLHPSIAPRIQGNVCSLGDAGTLRVHSGRLFEESYQYSPGYDRREPARRLLIKPKDAATVAYSFVAR
jgi:hypothetical protein